MIALRRKAIRANVVNHFRARYQQVKVDPVQGMFNFRCYENAVEYARTHRGMEVWEVVYIDDGDPILHYINRDRKTGRFLETTLGYRAANLEYYQLRMIPENDYKYIGGEFQRALDSWLHQFSTWFDRRVLMIARVL